MLFNVNSKLYKDLFSDNCTVIIINKYIQKELLYRLTLEKVIELFFKWLIYFLIDMAMNDACVS